jgi:hypothetical protein
MASALIEELDATGEYHLPILSMQPRYRPRRGWAFRESNRQEFFVPFFKKDILT